MTLLNRTVPFLACLSDESQSGVLLADRFFPAAKGLGLLDQKIARSLSLGAIADAFSPEECEVLVEEQYDAALRFIFLHPIWEDFRQGHNQEAMISYLLETRHYLHAAPWRMAPGPAGSFANFEVALHLAGHVVEEANHARFFEEALETLHYSRRLVSLLRPMPETLEWIHLSRFLASQGPLMAALCSGLLESTAVDRDTVRAWHDHLGACGLLPPAAAAQIRAHVDEDEALGHGVLWRKVLKDLGTVSASDLAFALNGVTLVAEAIDRWLDLLRSGAPALGLALIDGLEITPPEEDAAVADNIFSGDPVPHAKIVQAISDRNMGHGARAICTATYQISQVDGAEFGEERQSVTWITRMGSLMAACDPARIPEADGMSTLVQSWLCAIEGHTIWERMQESGCEDLVLGWLVENYHYLRSAPTHVSQALSSCPDQVLGDLLIDHLRDEADHANLIAARISETCPDVTPADLRPLPSTLAFAGALVDLARGDWRAYLLAIVFLQRTLEPATSRHERFYERVERTNPEVAGALRGIREHDDIDRSLDHADAAEELLTLLVRRWAPDARAARRAAMIPNLTQGFLNGVLWFYGERRGAPAFRIGWSAK